MKECPPQGPHVKPANAPCLQRTGDEELSCEELKKNDGKPYLPRAVRHKKGYTRYLLGGPPPSKSPVLKNVAISVREVARLKTTETRRQGIAEETGLRRLTVIPAPKANNSANTHFVIVN